VGGDRRTPPLDQLAHIASLRTLHNNR
jgi:hypothetical protein